MDSVAHFTPEALESGLSRQEIGVEFGWAGHDVTAFAHGEVAEK
jgi:hypothetical protein